ncbi:MAG: hypothetical protein LBB05_03010 [Puniceicoccales bacterium]|nr:hypothetical protein [Puniceicoccales bacterium]
MPKNSLASGADVIKDNEFSITSAICFCCIITACNPGGSGYCFADIVCLLGLFSEKISPKKFDNGPFPSKARKVEGGSERHVKIFRFMLIQYESLTS